MGSEHRSRTHTEEVSHCAAVAQLVEHRTEDPGIPSSILGPGTRWQPQRSRYDSRYFSGFRHPEQTQRERPVWKQPPSETEISCLLATMTLSCTLSSTRDTPCGFFRGPRDWLSVHSARCS